jgi:outer membrane protein TolC
MRRLPFLLSLLLLPSLASAAEPRPITLDEAVGLATKSGIEIREAEDSAAAARATAGAVNANLGPKLKAEFDAQDWNSGFNVQFGPTSFQLRDQFTSSFSLTAVQPITGLYGIAQQGKAAGNVAKAATADAATARAETIYRTTEAYLRLLEAIDLDGIAQAAVKDIEEQERTAKSLVSAGTLIQVDLLRTQVALAQARQDEIHAKAAVSIATAGLDAAIGLPLDTTLAPARVEATDLPKLPPDVGSALSDATSKRPELAAAKSRALAAHASAKSAFADALPSVAVVGNYTHLHGVSPLFQPLDSEFVLGQASWTFWDFGSQFRKSKAESYRARAADAEIDRQRRNVSLDVTSRFLEAQAAYAAQDVAHAAVAQASEAQRVTRSLYQNGGATTTDLLDAQLALERSRANDTRAAYDYRVAYAAFVRAAGE